MKNATILILFLGLTFSIVLLANSGKGRLETTSKPIIDGQKATLRTTVVRFPENKYFSVPLTAKFLTLKCLDKKANVDGITLYQFPRIEFQEVVLDSIVEELHGNRIDVSKFVGQKMFALVKTLCDDSSKEPPPSVEATFFDEERKEINQGTSEHHTGWIDIDYSTNTKVIFQSFSPIVSFTPLLRPKKIVKKNSLPTFHWGCTGQPSAGLSYTFLGPFRVMVTLPALYGKHQLSAIITRKNGYSPKGSIFTRKKEIYRGSSTSFRRISVFREIRNTTESIIPANTRKISIDLKTPYLPDSFSFKLTSNEGNGSTTYYLPLSKSPLETIFEKSKSNSNATQYRIIFEYDLSMIRDRNLMTMLDKNGSPWVMVLSFDSFSFSPKVAKNLNRAFNSFICMDKDGKIITNLVPSGVLPFTLIENNDNR